MYAAVVLVWLEGCCARPDRYELVWIGPDEIPVYGCVNGQPPYVIPGARFRKAAPWEIESATDRIPQERVDPNELDDIPAPPNLLLPPCGFYEIPTYAYDINNAGTVAGIQPTVEIESVTIRWETTPILNNNGSLPGSLETVLSYPNLHMLPTDTTRWSRPYAISDAGNIVGSIRGTSGKHGYYWNGSQVREFEDPMNGWDVLPQGVNDDGVIVGNLFDPEARKTYAFLYRVETDTIARLPVASASYAYDVNKHGVIVGGYSSAYFGHNVGRWIPIPPDNDTLGPDNLAWADYIFDEIEDSGVATALNDSGVVVGYHDSYVDQASTLLAFVWDPQTDVLLELETPNAHAELNRRLREMGYSPIHLSASASVALDINNCGDVVGWIDGIKAVLWRDGAVIDLNTVTNNLHGARLVSAYAINDTGHILVEARLENGFRRNGVLVPVRD